MVLSDSDHVYFAMEHDALLATKRAIMHAIVVLKERFPNETKVAKQRELLATEYALMNFLYQAADFAQLESEVSNETMRWAFELPKLEVEDEPTE